jgi:hypothetical protein
VVNVAWQATVGLRSKVLGWSDAQTRPDLDPEARHAAVLDSDGGIVAVVSMMVWPSGVEAVPFYVACGACVVGDPYVDEVTGRVDRRVVIAIA